jgi:transcriptional regulator with XRE-family HTH domain
MTSKKIAEQNIVRLRYLSKLLNELRLNSGMTQVELSQQMQLHRNTIIRAENAENLTLLTLFELVDALDISPKELFADIE